MCPCHTGRSGASDDSRFIHTLSIRYAPGGGVSLQVVMSEIV
jgi:hypothetical protein